MTLEGHTTGGTYKDGSNFGKKKMVLQRKIALQAEKS